MVYSGWSFAKKPKKRRRDSACVQIQLNPPD